MVKRQHGIRWMAFTNFPWQVWMELTEMSLIFEPKTRRLARSWNGTSSAIIKCSASKRSALKVVLPIIHWYGRATRPPSMAVIRSWTKFLPAFLGPQKPQPDPAWGWIRARTSRPFWAIHKNRRVGRHLLGKAFAPESGRSLGARRVLLECGGVDGLINHLIINRGVS